MNFLSKFNRDIVTALTVLLRIQQNLKILVPAALCTGISHWLMSYS